MLFLLAALRLYGLTSLHGWLLRFLVPRMRLVRTTLTAALTDERLYATVATEGVFAAAKAKDGAQPQVVPREQGSPGRLRSD